ncbi:MAG: hypothetical protein M0R40_08915 [Firmicutes bacterium]|nr:hypothetical protein [Bacillota bacterium]
MDMVTLKLQSWRAADASLAKTYYLLPARQGAVRYQKKSTPLGSSGSLACAIGIKGNRLNNSVKPTITTKTFL